MRRGITFHDGSPLTAHDVAFSLQLLKDKGHPIIQQLLHNFAGAQASDDTAVVVTLASGYARDLPLFIAKLPIFSRRYYAEHPFEIYLLDLGNELAQVLIDHRCILPGESSIL
jgi:microcin C transport system substrate-binding protein